MAVLDALQWKKRVSSCTEQFQREMHAVFTALCFHEFYSFTWQTKHPQNIFFVLLFLTHSSLLIKFNISKLYIFYLEQFEHEYLQSVASTSTFQPESNLQVEMTSAG